MSENTVLSEAKSHHHKLILRKNVQHLVHGSSAIGRFNAFLALKITSIVGSMWCAYIFALLTLVSLPAAIDSHNPIIIVGWIAQTFLQLVLLPIIIVGQNLQAETSDRRAESDHETLQAIHTLSAEIYRINEQQIKILEILERYEQKLKK